MKKTLPKKELVVVHNFNAPRELVWEAWTNPEKVKKWWGPKDFTCPHAEINLRKGGTYINCMRSSDGKECWSTGTYKEINAPQKLVCTDSFCDPDGNVVPSSYYGFQEVFPLVMTIELLLDEINTKTRMILIHSGIPKGDMRKQTKIGWRESFDKLEKVVIY